MGALGQDSQLVPCFTLLVYARATRPGSAGGACVKIAQVHTNIRCICWEGYKASAIILVLAKWDIPPASRDSSSSSRKTRLPSGRRSYRRSIISAMRIVVVLNAFPRSPGARNTVDKLYVHEQWDQKRSQKSKTCSTPTITRLIPEHSRYYPTIPKPSIQDLPEVIASSMSR